MIVNYHKSQKANTSLKDNSSYNFYPKTYKYNDAFNDKTDSNIRINAARKNYIVKKLANRFHTRLDGPIGTPPYAFYFQVPYWTSRYIREHTAGKRAFGWMYRAFFWHREWMHVLVERYINADNPVIFTAWHSFGNIEGQSTSFHSMPVIGYKTEYYVGVCWRHILPKKRWLAVDSTWRANKFTNPLHNARKFLRFDMRSNYWKYGEMVYLWVR